MVEYQNIAKKRKNGPNGVQFVTDSHWLIHRWVPRECIETELWFDDFRSFCERAGIVERKPKVPDHNSESTYPVQ